MSEQEKPQSFEASLTELEAVVKELETGDLPLERALSLFEKGTQLSAACRKQLEEAETRVEQLMRRGDKLVAEPMKTES
jgi:exodeoxyribonuclease VII small subunit